VRYAHTSTVARKMSSEAAPMDDDDRLSRAGDPKEFDDEVQAEVVDPDDVSDITAPPGLLRQLLANPAKAAELIALKGVEQHAARAARDVALVRERNPAATDRQLAVYFKKKHARAARWEGGGTGAAGIFGLPADLLLLAWIQNRLVLTTAAIYGRDLHDHVDLAADLLIIQGIHNSREVAKKALAAAAENAIRKLVLRHLRKEALVPVKQLFKLVGINFTRKALLEKGVPLVAIPISAGVNDASTRILANQAIKYYDTTIE
jgi:hypothetical protein